LGTEEDVIEALTKLAAENEGLTVEEYKRKLQDEQLLEEYKRSRVTEEAQKAKAQHLAEIKNRFPDVEAQSIEQLPNYEKYRKLMMTNLFSPSEAFEMVYDKTKSNKAQGEYERQKALNESKEHLRSINPKTVVGALKPIPKSEYEVYRRVFPNLSEKDLVKKYWDSKKL
jgi:hypothetical protein